MYKEILKQNNPHERDEFIKFYNNGHKYEISIDLKSKYTSVTTWCHSHFAKFDADAIIANIYKSKNWGPNNKYWNMTPEEIKSTWKKSGDSAANSGTNLHEQIEHFMNNEFINYPYSHNELSSYYLNNNHLSNNLSIEWEYFMNFIKEYPDLKPYRTEWMIFDEDLKLAGSIDMVYENADGTLSIYDWKRCKAISTINEWNKFAITPVISHIHDTNFWHYTLQLNTYKFILERKYNKMVTNLCLVILHPDNSNNTYQLMNVPILTKEMLDLLSL
jgi:ATP-dependent exoDNAse (exonuclease V) beta subunit